MNKLKKTKKSLFVKRPIKAYEVKQLSNDISEYWRAEQEVEKLTAQLEAGGKWTCVHFGSEEDQIEEDEFVHFTLQEIAEIKVEIANIQKVLNADLI